MKRGYSKDRREFLRGLGRGAGLGALLLGAGVLMDRPGSTNEECINSGICRGCSVFRDCGLPQALSAKEFEARQ